jgi:hypothetical protein
MTDNDAPAQPQGAPLGSGGPDPGRVLAYIPPRTWKHPVTKVFYQGVWCLFTADEWNGGEFRSLPEAGRLRFAPRDVSAELLAGWAGELLGCLVCLEPGAMQSAAGREGTLWRVAPVFVVWPDTSSQACPRCGARLAWRAEGSVHACPDQYTVSAWPPDHECHEAHLWSLLVAYRGGGRWAVELGQGHGGKPVLTRSGRGGSRPERRPRIQVHPRRGPGCRPRARPGSHDRRPHRRPSPRRPPGPGLPGPVTPGPRPRRARAAGQRKGTGAAT